MTIAVVGVGLIGGSMAIDLRKRRFCRKNNRSRYKYQHQNIALLCGIVDETGTLENAIDRSDLIILCTPVDSNCSILPLFLIELAVLQKLSQIWVQPRKIAEISRDNPYRGRYVAAHPMAGTEYSGPMAAHSRLFDYKTAIICDPELSDPDALEMVEKMLAVLKMKKVSMNSSEHDIHVAYVSHISHITSFSLALCVLDKEHEEQNILALAGGGFESTVRLAKEQRRNMGSDLS